MSDTTLKKCPIPGCGGSAQAWTEDGETVAQCENAMCLLSDVVWGEDVWNAFLRPSAELGEIAAWARGGVETAAALTTCETSEALISIFEAIANALEPLAAPEPQPPCDESKLMRCVHCGVALAYQGSESDGYEVESCDCPGAAQPPESVAEVMGEIQRMRSEYGRLRRWNHCVVRGDIAQGWIDRLSRASVGPVEVFVITRLSDGEVLGVRHIGPWDDGGKDGHKFQTTGRSDTGKNIREQRFVISGAQPKQETSGCGARCPQCRGCLECGTCECIPGNLHETIAGLREKLAELEARIRDALANAYAMTEKPSWYTRDVLCEILADADAAEPQPESTEQDDHPYCAEKCSAVTAEDRALCRSERIDRGVDCFRGALRHGEGTGPLEAAKELLDNYADHGEHDALVNFMYAILEHLQPPEQCTREHTHDGLACPGTCVELAGRAVAAEDDARQLREQLRDNGFVPLGAGLEEGQ
jgi:hypothetical protein